MASYVKIDVKPFTFGGTQEFDLWVRRYQRAVDIVLPEATTDPQKLLAYLKYIPTKLDDFSLKIYESSTNQANWPALKLELSAKLTDPARAQNFRDHHDSIKWDGEAPLHSYENTILTTTRDLDPDAAANDNIFKRETFKRFLAGLPPDYQSYIEMSLPVRTYDIEQARLRAEKYQELLKKNGGSNPLAVWAVKGIPPPMAAYNAYKDTSLDSLKEQISLLSLSQKENLEMQRETNKSIAALVEQLAVAQKAPPPPPPQYDSHQRNRTPSRERNSRQ